MISECTKAGFAIGLFFGSTIGYVIIEAFLRLVLKKNTEGEHNGKTS